MDDIYASLKLAKNEIRVLDILPPKNDIGTSIIECSLRIASLTDDNEQVNFGTVSYCWGNAKERKHIWVNNTLISIHANAEYAIRTTRLPDAVRTVWLDAVCVNQSDKNERMQQVALMADIYSRGMINNIVLGDAPAHLISRALRNLSDMRSDVLRSQGRYHKDDRIQILRSTSGSAPQLSFQLTALNLSFDLDALQCLYSRPWFGRIWVLQEATLALANNCFCGTLQFELLPVLEMAAFLHYCYSHHIPKVLSKNTGIADAAAMWLTIYFRKTGNSLCHLLRRGERLRCTEHQDRVFAVLGLHRPAYSEEVALTARYLLTPDYRKSLREIFRDATRAAILESGDLFMLSLISHHTQDDITADEFPSWTLRLDRRWSRKHNVVRLSSSRLSPQKLQEFVAANCLESPLYNADILNIPALILDSIAECSTTLVWDEVASTYQSDAIMEFLVSCFHIAALDSVEPNAVQQTLLRDLARTLIADRDHDGNEDVEDSYLDLLMNIHGTFGTKQPVIASGENVTQPAHDTKERTPQSTAFWTALERACRSRRLCRTSHGGLALVPRLAQSGDVIAMAHPHGYCCVLRTRPDCSSGGVFAFVGTCYMNAVRNAQATADFQQRRGLQMEWLHVR